MLRSGWLGRRRLKKRGLRVCLCCETHAFVSGEYCTKKDEPYPDRELDCASHNTPVQPCVILCELVEGTVFGSKVKKVFHTAGVDTGPGL